MCYFWNVCKNYQVIKRLIHLKIDIESQSLYLQLPSAWYVFVALTFMFIFYKRYYYRRRSYAEKNSPIVPDNINLSNVTAR